ncbi:hypothetical protein [Amycolatopsis anabasis]|uniref:hypothetical protein n=1 Tax=Amycolatopsis anabasis TaxID=1840409 RepID=UPI00131CD7B8|nr:hypothetical protein [Amycolatopsis anabasis]
MCTTPSAASAGPSAVSEPTHQGTGLTPVQFQQAHLRAEARRSRWRNRRREQQIRDGYDAATTDTDSAIAAAPHRIDLATFAADHPDIELGKARLLADGKLIYLRPRTRRWALAARNGLLVVRGVDFRVPGGTDYPGKPAGIRAVTELADLLAGLRDGQGRLVPWASPRRDWPLGWRGENALSIAGAATPVIAEWAARHGVDYANGYLRGQRRPRPVVGGIRDAEGYVLARDPGEAAPGDRIRHDGATYTVRGSRIGRVQENWITRYQLILAAERDGEQISLTEPGSIDIAFAGDPDAPEARYSPGMGLYLDRPGIPVDRQNPHYVDLRREDLVPPGTRVLARYVGDPDEVNAWYDPRPTVGTTTDHIVHAEGHCFQVIEMDDGTFDGVKPTALTRPNPSADAEYQLDPEPDEVAAAHRAWGLHRPDQP